MNKSYDIIYFYVFFVNLQIIWISNFLFKPKL
jgi:hypothetical protein